MQIVSVPNAVKIRPDAAFPVGGEVLDLAAAGNEATLGQLVLRAASPFPDLRISASALAGPDGAELPMETWLQHYIRTDRATTPAFEPGWYPDALTPLGDSVSLDAEQNLSLWFKVTVPDGQPPGEYRGTVMVDTQAVPVTLRVWGFSLPPAGHCRTAFAIWYDQIAAHHEVELDSAEHWALAEKYYLFQLDRRLPADDLPLSPRLSASGWLRAATRFLEDPRVIAYRIPARTADPAWTEEVVAGLRVAGWLDRGYFYLDEIDEPTAGGIEEPRGGAARVRDICAWLDELAPEVEHLVTAEPVPELEGAVHTWVPLFDRFDAKDARDRESKDEWFWWYGCIYPTHPYPSYHIDDDLMAARVIPWLMHRDRIRGNLYWATTIFGKWDGEKFVRRDPWTDPIAWPSANGDGMLIYPSPEGPLPSIRLEAIAAGQSDYEYLRLLDEALQDIEAVERESILADYRDRIVRSATDFDRSGQDIEHVRRAIAAHILRLRGSETISVAQPTRAVDQHLLPELAPRELLSSSDAVIDGFDGSIDGDTLRLRAGMVAEDRPAAYWGVDRLVAGDVFAGSVINRACVSSALFVVFVRDDGVRQEAARVMVRAGESCRFSVPAALALMDPARIVECRIEMMPHQPGADLDLFELMISAPTP